MIDTRALREAMLTTSLAAWSETIDDDLNAAISERDHGDEKKWQPAMDALPDIESTQIDMPFKNNERQNQFSSSWRLSRMSFYNFIWQTIILHNARGIFGCVQNFRKFGHLRQGIRRDAPTRASLS